MPCKNAPQALGASAVRFMTGIACSLATSPTSAPAGNDEEDDDDDEANDEEDKSAQPDDVVEFDAGTCCDVGRFDDGGDDDVENRVQQLFDNMPDYTNVTNVTDQSGRKYAPVQI